MAERYPPYDTVPVGWLVPPDRQPDYLERPSSPVGDPLILTEFLIDRHVCEGRGDRVAIHVADDGSRYTYADLSRDSAELADGLRELDIRPGDRVAVSSPNRPEALVASLAAWRLGAIAALTPAAARQDELRFFLKDTKAKVIVVANSGPCIGELDAVDRGHPLGRARDLLPGRSGHRAPVVGGAHRRPAGHRRPGTASERMPSPASRSWSWRTSAIPRRCSAQSASTR